MSQRLKNFFSYHPNVNLPIRIVSFLFALSGILGVLVSLVGLMVIASLGGYFVSIFFVPFIIGGILNIILSYGLSRMRKWVIYLLGIITVALLLIGNPYFVINLLIFIMVLVYRKRFEGNVIPSVSKKSLLIVIAFITIIVVGFFAWQYFSTDRSASSLSDDRVVENEVSQSISIISPSRGERWYMGEENNIKINSPKEHYDKVVYILIAGGKDQGGLIIGCNVKVSEIVDGFNWNTGSVLRECEGEYAGQYFDIHIGIYQIFLKESNGDVFSILGESEPFVVNASGVSPYPFINYITPSVASLGDTIEIVGSGFSGFEGDIDVYFEREDNKKIRFYNKLKGYSISPEREVVKIELKDPCKEGEIVYGEYSGLPSTCDYVELKPGLYEVYAKSWGNTSNKVSFTVQGSGNWKVYKSDQYRVEMEYPSDWGSVTFMSQKTKDIYVFSSESEIIDKIYYHKPTKTIAFVENGRKYDLEYGGEGAQKILKIINSNKEIKTIYTISEVLTRWYGDILDVNLSPDAKYIYFMISGYELFYPLVINISTLNNIIEDYDIWFEGTYKDIYWTSNNQILNIKSVHNDFSGEGINGMFISEYGNPENLREVQ